MFFLPDTTVRPMTTSALYRINCGFFCIFLFCTLLFTSTSFSTAFAADEGAVKPPAASDATNGSASTTTALDVSMTALPVEWLLDTTGSLGVEQLRQPAQRSAFSPFGEDFFTDGSRSAGILWFRIALAPLSDALQHGNVVIDLSKRVRHSLPHGATVWLDSVGNKPITRLIADAHGFLPIPASASISNVVYIRVDGQPSFGFAPVARSASILSFFDNYGEWLVRCLLMCALALSLLRGIVEQREWRMWSALFAATLLVTEFWGAPATTLGKVFPPDLPGLLAPGVALLIFPHIGRQLMRTRDSAPWIDIFFILIGPLGLAATLVPLLPGQVWTVRYLQMWPLLMLLPLPVTLFAVVRGIPGALRFAFCCLLPPLGLVALLPMPEIRFAAASAQIAWASFMALLPALCATSSAILLACLPTPKHTMPERRHESIPLENSATLSLTGLSVATTMSGSQDAKRNEAASAAHLLALLEQRLRGPMDDLHIELHALSHMALPSAAKEHVQRLLRAGNDVTQLMYDEASGIHGLTSPAMMGDELSETALRKEPFDLHGLIRNTHNAIAGEAEHKNLALTWYTAPQLASQYVGDPVRLSRVLTLLAESAVGATAQGLVQIRVQRLPESNDPGHLLFTVSDTGKGIPPVDRSTMAIVRAWELSAAYGGTVSIDSGPSGTIVSFTLRLRALGRAKSTEWLGKAPVPAPSSSTTISDALRIFVVSDVPSNRELLTYFLDELPHEVREARSADEVLAMYTQTPGALLLFDGDLPEHEVVAGIAEIRAFEGEQGLPLTSILAIVNDEEQGERLRRAGCKHTLLKPVTRTELRRMALRLAPVPKPRKAAPQPATPKPEKPFVVFTAPPPVETLPLETPLAVEQPPANKDSGMPQIHVSTKHNTSKACDASVAAQPATSQPDANENSAQSAPRGAAKSRNSKEELIFLQPPTLRVRSNVGDPKPLIRTDETREDAESAARKHRAETLRQTLETKRLKTEEPASGTEPTKLHKLASQAIARSHSQTPSAPKQTSLSNNTVSAETLTKPDERATKTSAAPVSHVAAAPQTEERTTASTQTLSAPPLHNAPSTEPNATPTAASAPSAHVHATLPHGIEQPPVAEAAPLHKMPLPERALSEPAVPEFYNTAGEAIPSTKHRVHVGTVDDTAPKNALIPDILFPTEEPKKSVWGRLFGKFTKKSPEKTAQTSSLQPDIAPLRAAGEWVGEPQPIVRTPQPAPEGDHPTKDAENLLPPTPNSGTATVDSESLIQPENAAIDTTLQTTATDADTAINNELFLLNDDTNLTNDEPFLLTDDMITQPSNTHLLPTLDDSATDKTPKATRKEPQRSALLYLPGMEPDSDTLELNLAPPMDAQDTPLPATPEPAQSSNAPLSFDPPDTESLAITDTTVDALECHLGAYSTSQTADAAQPLELSQDREQNALNAPAHTGDTSNPQHDQLQQQENHADALGHNDEEHVEVLLQRLAKQCQEAQAAFDRNDMEGVSDMGTHMAYTAQSLGMPSLVDLTLCLAEEALSGQAETAAPLLEDVRKAVANECSLGNDSSAL